MGMNSGVKEPKIIGWGRTRREQDLLDEYMLSFITRAQLEDELRRLHEEKDESTAKSSLLAGPS